MTFLFSLRLTFLLVVLSSSIERNPAVATYDSEADVVVGYVEGFEKDQVNEVESFEIDNALNANSENAATSAAISKDFNICQVPLNYLHKLLAELQAYIIILEHQVWIEKDQLNRELISEVLRVLWELKENSLGLLERIVDLRESHSEIQNTEKAALEESNALVSQKLEFVREVSQGNALVISEAEQLVDEFNAYYQAKLDYCDSNVEQLLHDYSAQVQRIAIYYKAGVVDLLTELLGYLKNIPGHETDEYRHRLVTKLKLLFSSQAIFGELDVQGAALLDAYEQQFNCVEKTMNESIEAIHKLDADITLLLNNYLDNKDAATEQEENQISGWN